MENRINVAELLKDCPIGMELDCTIYDDVTLYNIDDSPKHEYPIRIKTKNGYFLDLTKYGTYTDIDEAKCVIFPKGKTTWEGFQKPFKDGDIISDGRFIAIFHKFDEGHIYYHCWYNLKYNEFKAKIDCGIGYIKEYRYATKEEKAKLFQVIKDNGYKWNPETKSLEKSIKPKFKIGDRIKSVISSSYYTVVDIKNNQYFIKQDTEKYPYQIPFSNEINYKLVPSKFDITTLIPFESRVLVRSDKSAIWKPAIYGIYKDSLYWMVGGSAWIQCIPYEGDEHLLGTTDDCDEFYKNW